MDFGKYFSSAMGGLKESNHSWKIGFQLLMASVFAGYTATALPAEFLKLFEHPILQFCVFYVMFNQMHENAPTGWIFMDGVLSVLLVQGLLYVTRRLYTKKGEESPSFLSQLTESTSEDPIRDHITIAVICVLTYMLTHAHVLY